MNILRLSSLLLVCITVGCAWAQPQKEIAKVKVTQAGGVYLNGKPVTPSEFGQELARLQGRNGVIWYFREAPEQQPSDLARVIFNTIIDAEIPVCLFEKDFDTQIESDALQCFEPP